MGDVNFLVGGPAPVSSGSRTVAPVTDEAAAAVTARSARDDRTEYVVAALVLGALTLLILFRVAGLNAVIATRVAVGG